MRMDNLIEYSNDYLKASGSLCQHYKDESSLNPGNDAIAYFTGANHNSKSFK